MFYSVFRRIKGKIQKKDYNYESRLELLEIYYIISLIEHYLENPTRNPKAKKKRGKDFIYTLIHNLTLDNVKLYKSRMQQYAKNEGTLDDLFKSLTSFYNILESPNIAATSTLNTNPLSNISYTSLGNSNTILERSSNPIPSTQSIKDNNNLLENEEVKAMTLIDAKSTNLVSSYVNEEAFFEQFNFSEYEILLYIDLDIAQPAPLFSPSSLSAEPAAAAVGAFRAACFIDGEFGDLATSAKQPNDERIKHLTDLSFSARSVGEEENKLVYSGFHYKSYFQQ
jgi:hypothetical protein